jgi:carboxyl-terminal processing protease
MFKNGKFKKAALLVSAVSLLTLCLAFGVQRSRAAQSTDNDYESMQLFTDVLTLVKKSYVEQVDTKKLVYGAINGMLSSLDPHSSFMSPEGFKELQRETQGTFAGVGLEITLKDGLMTVISPIEDTPAFKAGIKAGDLILKIDDKFTQDLPVLEAVKKMRGEKGTKVTLTVMRTGFEKAKEFELKREVIQVKSVKFKMLDDGYGYLRISEFQEKTDEDLEKALKSMQADHKALKGLVLDLRNNPGGLLEQAVRVCEHFVAEGKLIVYTDGREKDAKQRFTSGTRDKQSNYPIVVLINSGSASASEIVAGCLQDNKRALILGTQSFGKGSVQTVIPLADNSALRLTTARYFTPSGRSIQAKGITPDVVAEKVEMTAASEQKAGLHITEKDLEHHFEGDKTDDKSAKPAPYKADEAVKGDSQLLRALDLLKGWDILKGMEQASR